MLIYTLYFSFIIIVPFCYIKIFWYRKNLTVPGSGKTQRELTKMRKSRNIVTFFYNITIWSVETLSIIFVYSFVFKSNKLAWLACISVELKWQNRSGQWPSPDLDLSSTILCINILLFSGCTLWIHWDWSQPPSDWLHRVFHSHLRPHPRPLHSRQLVNNTLIIIL